MTGSNVSAWEFDLSPHTVTQVAIVAAGLEQLSEPELLVLELAWDALLAGTIPVGAVVVGADGQIIASGRNAVYGQPDPRFLCGSRLGAADALIEAGVFAMAASRMTWAQAAPKLLAAV